MLAVKQLRPQFARVLATPWTGVFSTQIDSGHQFTRHWHDGYAFGYLERGAQRWYSQKGHVRGYQGDVIDTNPGEVHDGAPIGAESRRWRILYMDVESMAGFASVPAGRVAIGAPAISDPLLHGATMRMFAAIEAWNGGHCTSLALACEETITESCTLLMSRHGSAPFAAPSVPEDVRLVRERLADDAARVPTLAELAGMVGLSRYQVLRRFGRVYGLPPHAWLLRRRAEQARVEIARGTPLSEAAARCGFADQSHMTRVFVKQFGFTPGSWRQVAAPRPA